MFINMYRYTYSHIRLFDFDYSILYFIIYSVLDRLSSQFEIRKTTVDPSRDRGIIEEKTSRSNPGKTIEQEGTRGIDSALLLQGTHSPSTRGKTKDPVDKTIEKKYWKINQEI